MREKPLFSPVLRFLQGVRTNDPAKNARWIRRITGTYILHHPCTGMYFRNRIRGGKSHPFGSADKPVLRVVGIELFAAPKQLRKQVIPTAREMVPFESMMEDSLAEDKHSPVPGLVHRNNFV